jgi:hypothetical protein
LEVVQEAEDGLEEEEADYYGAEDGVGCVVELFDVRDAMIFEKRGGVVGKERYEELMLALQSRSVARIQLRTRDRLDLLPGEKGEPPLPLNPPEGKGKGVGKPTRDRI